ncbi:hypothetical protein BKA70DRAFT_1412019 [Coprinopsis sp. MPI-PUGE-AT-0042]|nr:hypothetical protein BKA70DRAFT_1412019 [Coprinopsis sp. MPI-PUGE-AT-0042]
MGEACQKSRLGSGKGFESDGYLSQAAPLASTSTMWDASGSRKELRWLRGKRCFQQLSWFRQERHSSFRRAQVIGNPNHQRLWLLAPSPPPYEVGAFASSVAFDKRVSNVSSNPPIFALNWIIRSADSPQGQGTRRQPWDTSTNLLEREQRSALPPMPRNRRTVLDRNRQGLSSTSSADAVDSSNEDVASTTPAFDEDRATFGARIHNQLKQIPLPNDYNSPTSTNAFSASALILSKPSLLGDSSDLPSAAMCHQWTTRAQRSRQRCAQHAQFDGSKFIVKPRWQQPCEDSVGMRKPLTTFA